jgi:hypothetical protein
MKTQIGDRQPARGLPPQIEPDRVGSVSVRESVQGLRHDHSGDHLHRDRGPTPPDREQIREHLLREQRAKLQRTVWPTVVAVGGAPGKDVP